MNARRNLERIAALTARRSSTSRSSDLPEMLAQALLAASDPLDRAAWERLLVEEVHVRVANRKVAVGIAASRAELARFFARVEAIGRGFRELWPGQDGRTVLMVLDLCAAGDVVLPIVIVARTAADRPLAKDLRFYLDPRLLEMRAANGHG